MREDGTLFGYFEAPESLEAALAGMSQEAINAKWQDCMTPYFESVGQRHADRMMEALEPVFFLE